MTTTQRPRPGFLGERGAAAVEFALIVPILLTLLFGIVEYSKVFQVQASLSAAAREGVRAVALGNSVAQARTVILAAAAPVPLTTSQISFDRSSCAGATATTTVTATITYRQPFVSGLFGGAGVNLTGRAVMRCGG